MICWQTTIINVIFLFTISAEPPMPTDIAVKHHELFPHTSLMVSFKEITTGTDASYVITAQCVTQPSTTRAETKTSIGLLEKLIPGTSYKIFVTAKQGDLLSKKAYYPDFIQTCKFHHPHPYSLVTDVSGVTGHSCSLLLLLFK